MSYELNTANNPDGPTEFQEQQLRLITMQQGHERRMEEAGLLDKVREVIRADYEKHGKALPPLEPDGLTRAMAALFVGRNIQRPLVQIVTVKPNSFGIFEADPSPPKVAIGMPFAGGFMAYNTIFTQDDVNMVTGMLETIKAYRESGAFQHIKDDLAGFPPELPTRLQNIPTQPMKRPGKSDSRFDHP